MERRHAVFQDRLVKELRLRRIDDMAGANALLEGSFLAEINRRFAVKPASSVDLHRPVSAGVCVADVLCVVEERGGGERLVRALEQPLAAGGRAGTRR